jgi:anti-sigma regulatory factor (Ser/Thr protein kinase)
MNAIVHGNESDVTKAVKVSVIIFETQEMIYCVVHITDEGLQDFSVEKVIEEATSIENLDRVGGRGMLMARGLHGIEIFDPFLLEGGRGKRMTFVRDMPIERRNGGVATDQ